MWQTEHLICWKGKRRGSTPAEKQKTKLSKTLTEKKMVDHQLKADVFTALEERKQKTNILNITWTSNMTYMTWKLQKYWEMPFLHLKGV